MFLSDAIIGFSETLYTTIEGGVVAFTISLNAVSSFPVSVEISTVDITATGTKDKTFSRVPQCKAQLRVAKLRMLHSKD